VIDSRPITAGAEQKNNFTIIDHHVQSTTGGRSMKIFASFLFVLIAVFVLTAPVHAQPKISLGRTSIEVGTIYHGEIKKIPLLIRNAGTDTLKIENIQTSCGCTSVKKPKPYLLPGESDTLAVEFNSMGFNGPIEKHITITSNDPAAPISETIFRGTVISEIEVTPGQYVIWIGAGPMGKELKQTVMIKNSSSYAIAVKNFSVTDSAIHAEFQKKNLAPGESLTVLFSVTPRVDTYIEMIGYFETNSSRQPRVPLRIGYLGTK
jgi:archaellum component FlaF (FlaF/FlaG flagellin family)